MTTTQPGQPVETSTTTTPAVCPLDCPDTCSLAITHANGEILAVRGSRGNPFTAGRICSKVSRHYPEFTHGDNRIRYPLKRVGAKGAGEFERISWDEALDLAYAGLSRVVERHGAQAVVPFNYAGPHGLLANGSMDTRFFHRLGASLVDRAALCGGIRGLAYTSLYGGMPGMGPEQAEHAQLIIVWSNNVTVSNLHLTRVINTAKRSGAKLVVIDPKRIKIAEQADLFLPVRPGTDVVLGYALACELERLNAIDHAFVEQWTVGFEEYMREARKYPAAVAAELCGIPQADIETLAQWYIDASPAAISVGNGMERSVTGGASLRTAMALPALAGKFGVVGGGVIAKPGAAFPKTPEKLQRPDWIAQGTRTLNIMGVSEHILDDAIDPPVRGLVIYNHNPVATHPDQHRMQRALCHPDLFTVGIEVAMTDSMDYADVVLPASGPFEINDIYVAYGQQFLQRAEPVIPSVGESLPNTEIFRRLAKRFGFDDPAFSATDLELMDDALDASDPRMNGICASELAPGTSIHMRINDEPMVAFKNVYPSTPSEKIELLSEDLANRFGAGVPTYVDSSKANMLRLISPSSNQRTNATFGGVAANRTMEILELNPIDASARNLSDGQTVRVYNELGETDLIVSVTDATRPGVAYTPKGTWLCTSPNAQTINALVPDLRADIADGACFNDTFIEVEGRA
ncbi:MAG: molybdopterin-dependent oxidoreductase [Chromatiales bacterium]|jgi:anaerobic selenocysteine-containing dehydrogenase|nr:molybdopterin-dependent oxidoreductase [Chromatiales bacterium]